MARGHLARERPNALGLVLALGAFLGALAWLQLGFPRLVDGDSYFHARAAQQLAEHGIRTEFPQAAFSTWRDRYSDKDFLFHLFLIPFVGEEASLRGGKIAVIAADALLLAGFGLALARLRVRFAALFVLLLASADPWLWIHLLALRPHLLGLALLLLEIALALEGRWKALAAASAAHVLAHTSFLLLPALPLAQMAAAGLRREPLPWRPAAGVGLGIAAASLLHPYFPNNLTIAFDQAVEVARSVAGTRPELPRDLFGSELLPMTAAGLLQVWPVWLAAGAGQAALLLRWPAQSPSREALSLAGLALALLAVCGLANRFAAFFLPVAALAAARAWSELAGAAPLAALARRPAAWAGALLLAACVLCGQLRAWPGAVRASLLRLSHPVEDARGAVAFLERRAAPEDVVYHNFWMPFAALYYFRPDGRYIEALDPIFLYRFDPELFAGMLAVYRGEAPDPHRVIARDFGARFVFVRKLPSEQAMARGIARDPRFRRVYDDPGASVFEVAP